MRPLFLGKTELDAIAQLRAHAEANPMSFARCKEAIGDVKKAIGNDPNYSLIVPLGFRCVFSVEMQPIGLCRHLSISLLDGDKLPHPAAVLGLAHAFGFSGDLYAMEKVWIEPLTCGGQAVNLIQIKG